MNELNINTGEFIIPLEKIAEKSRNIKAYIFEWDGVFNSGVKGEGISSPYYEADSLGFNMLRFAYWLHNRDLPYTGLIINEYNSSAIQYASQQHFQSLFYSLKNKTSALDHIMQTYGISSEQVAYVYDDIPSLSLAEQCGLRFLVQRKASGYFTDYVKTNKLCDYVTTCQGGDFALREITDLLLYLSGEYDYAIKERINFSFIYESYLNIIETVAPAIFTFENGKLIKK